MISEDDIVYVKVIESDSFMGGSSTNIIGSGFSSEEEVKDKIEYMYDRNPGEYAYGILEDTMGAVTIPEPEDKQFSDTERDILDEISNKFDTDERITNGYIYESTQTNVRCSIFKNNIKYLNGEVDFQFGLKTDLFDSVPISTHNEEKESIIIDMFNDITDGKAEYLGFKSSYSQRGRRNPYINVYGRIHRASDKDKQIRDIFNQDYVKQIYWSKDNLNPIPIYYLDKDELMEEDVILVLRNVCNDNSYDSINENILEKVYRHIEDIESKSNLKSMWIGKTSYKDEYDQICTGVKYVE